MPTATIDREVQAELEQIQTLGQRLEQVEWAIQAAADKLGVAVPDGWGQGTPETRVQAVQEAIKELLARAESGAYSLDEKTLRQLERQCGVLCEVTNELGKRHAKPGAIRKRMASDSLATTNATAMSARCTISTPTPDRSRDVVMPLGAVLTNYMRNPVVYFDHGQSGITMPIGKSRNPSGKLTVFKSASGVDAECYFSQSSLEAAQVFNLIEEGVVNCASVHLIPLKCHRLNDGGLHIDTWDLLEWSWVGIPDNPEAVRKVLAGGKLAGRTIVEPLQKSLRQSQVRALLDERHALVKGLLRASRVSGLLDERRALVKQFGELILQVKGKR